MKATIYNPYLDTLGGGERYSMAIAATLAKHGYTVDIEWKAPSIKEKLENRLGINLKNINFIPDVKRGDGYDLCFWVSDGSVPTLRSRKNLLHFQVPFTNVGGTSLLNKFKFMRINKILVNSEFTKRVIDREFGVDSVVLYPPISVNKFNPKRKENVILSVARFSELMQPKRQDILIRAFEKLFDSGINNYRLVLAGGNDVGSENFLKKLRRAAKDYPIDIIESPNFKILQNFYGVSKIFWSAAGFGINENKEPKKVEHFGIAVVESMAAGCVPIVFSAGGHKESVKHDTNGFLWNNVGELIKFTKQIINDEKLRRRLSTDAKGTSQKFSYEEFEERFITLL